MKRAEFSARLKEEMKSVCMSMALRRKVLNQICSYAQTTKAKTKRGNALKMLVLNHHRRGGRKGD